MLNCSLASSLTATAALTVALTAVSVGLTIWSYRSYVDLINQDGHRDVAADATADTTQLAARWALVTGALAALAVLALVVAAVWSAVRRTAKARLLVATCAALVPIVAVAVAVAVDLTVDEHRTAYLEGRSR